MTNGIHLRPEYDFAALGRGVRGRYADRLRGTTLVALKPEMAAAFPTSEAVNDALRAVLGAKAVARRSRSTQRRTKATGRGK